MTLHQIITRLDSFIPRRIILLIHTALKWNNIGIAIHVDEKGYGLSSTVPPFQSPFTVGMTLNVITSNIIGTDTTLCNVLLHRSFVHLSIKSPKLMMNAPSKYGASIPVVVLLVVV
jgi:hypothetical protein